MEFISEQQKDVVLSDAQHRLINGCAGSRKTDTLIKCAVHYLQTQRAPVLFLTLVGSVTHEIKTRLETALGICIERQGVSNHYVGHTRDGVGVCVSNYDAWVHLMLPAAHTHGTQYTRKVHILLEHLKTQTRGDVRGVCRTRCGESAGLLLIDEAQDLGAAKMRVIVEVCRLDPVLRTVVCGDYLQTLFPGDDEADGMDAHAMNTYRVVAPACFALDVCWRCPPSHIAVANALLAEPRTAYGIPAMRAAISDTDNTHRPMFFAHDKTTCNYGARRVAEYITHIVRTVMDHDTSITPDDVAVIMPKSRDNLVFFHLVETLTAMYAQRGLACAAVHMNTEGDGRHCALDWPAVAGHTKLLSVHGDKGRGHRLVLFAGVTEMSLPQQHLVGRADEILAHSLLNVGITRSTQYLFVGFYHDFPSRYVRDFLKKPQHDTTYYTAWSRDTQTLPQPYAAVADAVRVHHLHTFQRTGSSVKYFDAHTVNGWSDVCGERYAHQTHCGTKSRIDVRDDIARAFEHVADIVGAERSADRVADLVCTDGAARTSDCVTSKVFGKTQHMRRLDSEQHYATLGTLCELLVQRKKNGRIEWQHRPILYDDDNTFIAVMRDFDAGEADYDVPANLRVKFDSARAVGALVVHRAFAAQQVRDDIAAVLSRKPNEKIATRSLWNFAVFYIHATRTGYNPCTVLQIDYLQDDISTIHDNVARFAKTLPAARALRFEGQVGCSATVDDPADLHTLFPPKHGKVSTKKKHTVSIQGRYDMFDTRNNALYEFKASHVDGCPQAWIIQVMMYDFFLREREKITPVRVCVVNFLSGVMYVVQHHVRLSVADKVLTKVAAKYRWHEIEYDAIHKGFTQTTTDVIARYLNVKTKNA